MHVFVSMCARVIVYFASKSVCVHACVLELAKSISYFHLLRASGCAHVCVHVCEIGRASCRERVFEVV